MALLGERKQILLNQLKRQPTVNLQTLVSWVNQYEDLEVEDFRGYISDELFEQLMEVFRALHEAQLWDQIMSAPRETPKDIQNALQLMETYIDRFPRSPKCREAHERLRSLQAEMEEEEYRKKHSCTPPCCEPDPKPIDYCEPEQGCSPVPDPKPCPTQPSFEPCPPPPPCAPVPEECCPSPQPSQQSKGITYIPHSRKQPWWKRLKFWSHKDDRKEVCTSVFAPAEISKGRNMIVQLFLHLAEEEQKVIDLAMEVQSDAVRKGYDTLHQFLKVGDIVKVTLTIYGIQDTLFQEEKAIIWKGHFSKCEFRYAVSRNIKEEELCCELTFRLEGLPFPIGEMIFTSSIKENPRVLNAKIMSKAFRHVFVSYSHKDEKEVILVVKTLKAFETSFFFDQISLSGGDVFNEVIMENIDKSDLFVLCWSKNSAKSEYVRKEVERALPRAYPQAQPHEEASLKFYPISIEPVAALPDYLRDYHFESLYIH